MFQARTPKVLPSAFLLLVLCAGPVAAAPDNGAGPLRSVSEKQVSSLPPVREPALVASDGGQVFAFPARPDVPANLPAANGPNVVASGTGPRPYANASVLSVDDRDNSNPVGWAVYEHQTVADVLNTAITNNYRVVDLFVEGTTSTSLLTAVYVANTGSYAKTWWFLADVTPATLLTFYTSNNARIVVLKAFNDPAPGGDVRYFAILISNTGADAKSWWYYHDQSVAQITALWQANNARLVQANSYVKGGTTLYDVVMISNTGSDARGWWWYVNATVADLVTRVSANNARLVDLDIDPTTGNYNAIMTSCSGGCPAWWWYVGLPTSNLLATVLANNARIIDANSTAGCGDRCWSVVLIANNAPVLGSAASRKHHGAAGDFDLPLLLTVSNPTTEPRQGPAATIVFTFDKPLTGAAVTVSEGTATAGAPTFSGNSVIVSLSGVADQQYVTVNLSNVSSADGGTGGSGTVRVGFLAGDVNQSRVVTLADLGLVNAQLSQIVTAANYLKDLNASGTLTLSDKAIANARLTKALPAP
jgi:hypothetical protein